MLHDWTTLFSRLAGRPTGTGHLPAAARRRRRAVRPLAERLDDRQLLSTLTVTSAADCGAGSLRAAIASAHSGDTITLSAGRGLLGPLSAGATAVKRPGSKSYDV
jgi:hypothetical protein